MNPLTRFSLTALLAICSQASGQEYQTRIPTKGLSTITPLVLKAADGSNLTTLNFGSVSTGQSSPPLTISMSNMGSTSATLGSPVFSVTAPYAVTSTTCSSVLAAGSTCSAALTFTPSQALSYPGKLTANTGRGGPLEVALVGQGRTPVQLTFFTFGFEQGQTVPDLSYNPNQTTDSAYYVSSGSRALFTCGGSATVTFKSPPQGSDITLRWRESGSGNNSFAYHRLYNITSGTTLADSGMYASMTSRYVAGLAANSTYSLTVYTNASSCGSIDDLRMTYYN